jgi:hypothetical protein
MYRPGMAPCAGVGPGASVAVPVELGVAVAAPLSSSWALATGVMTASASNIATIRIAILIFIEYSIVCVPQVKKPLALLILS